MDKTYKIIFLITCHESKECLIDLIKNVKKYNKDIAIIVSNGKTEIDFSDLILEDVFIINREVKTPVTFPTLIPIHLELFDFIQKQNLKSEYIFLLSSNQLFINYNVYELIKGYDSSFFERENIDEGYLNFWNCDALFKSYYEKLELEFFKYQSNHDGMFFKYDIFQNMMEYFDEYRNVSVSNHQEEFLYIAYILKYHNKKLLPFSSYNYFSADICGKNLMFKPLTIESVIEQKQKGMFVVKRVERNIEDEVRNYIRNLE